MFELVMAVAVIALLGCIRILTIGRLVITPPVGAGLFIIGIGAAGYCLYNSPYQPQLLGIQQRLPEDISLKTLLTFVAAGSAFALGASLARSGQKARPGRTVAPITISRPTQSAALAIGSTTLAVGALAAYILGRSPQALLQSKLYLTISGPELLARLGLATLPVGLLAAMLLASAPKGNLSAPWRFTGTLLTLLYVLVLFSAATRLLAAIPVVWMGLRWLWGSRPSGRSVVMAATMTLPLLALPLRLREQAQHGLIPYAAALIEKPDMLLDVDGSELLGNILISVPLTQFVLDKGLRSAATLWISLSPLPGGPAGWDDLAPMLRVNLYVPYSAIGEAFSHGAVFGPAYFVAVGYVFAALWQFANRCPGLRGTLLQLAVLGMLGLYSLQALQYNLRTCTRLVFYALALAAIMRVINTVGQRRPKNGRATEIKGVRDVN